MSVSTLVILVLHLWLPAQAHTSFRFNKFNASTLYQIGNSSIRSGAICLTNQTQHMSSRDLYRQPIRMKADHNSRNTSSSFSTTFVFAIVPFSSNPLRSGQGMAFKITPSKSPVGQSSTQFLGLFNSSSIGQPSNHLFAVEFDTILNEEYLDINDNTSAWI
ncbi:lectin-like protein At1g53080 [Cryptomeria japonica]|uniref:lectin-like protein At1g53080 n=1 Tax=Cryptomeria japonica TaxID=3369 RepID=UPI0027DAB2DC|nr:lectin-like protein At1g53080 [Cryptomeria japonica]